MEDEATKEVEMQKIVELALSSGFGFSVEDMEEEARFCLGTGGSCKGSQNAKDSTKQADCMPPIS